ncbi:hypothetical protein E2C01_040222 [Portunus trituberculatus]|uniref:Uncharacterized protein n=1 Tax=Portunus trituberculatus TaxID=210409 RepID=A0A5B7FJ41_PORTR|nr:hypothetical protein [Portunus trituberculatus]
MARQQPSPPPPPPPFPTFSITKHPILASFTHHHHHHRNHQHRQNHNHHHHHHHHNHKHHHHHHVPTFLEAVMKAPPRDAVMSNLKKRLLSGVSSRSKRSASPPVKSTIASMLCPPSRAS